ncbi:unnamed protein product [Calypogeia fissa]
MTGGCICAICYEDVDPAGELLQSIAVCGHVFHELCLQQWIEFCPNGRTPTCPLCKQNCGVEDVHRLYFQSDSCLGKKDATPQPGQKNPSDRELSEEDQAQLLRLEAKVTMLTAECKSSREKILRAESEGHRHLEQVRGLETEKLKWRKERSQLVESLAKAHEELRRTIKHREELLAKTEAMAKDVAVYRLATDVNLSEVDISRLIAPPHSSTSKEDMIDMMTKALFLQNRAFKDLMHKCQEIGMGESRAEQKSQRLMEQVKRMKARIQELAKAEEEKENAKVRSLTRTRISAETTRRPGLSVNDVNSCHLANASENIHFVSRPKRKAKRAGESDEAGVPPNVICLDGDSDAPEAQAQAQRTKVDKQGCAAGLLEMVPATGNCEGELTLGDKHRKNRCGTSHMSGAHSQSINAQTREDCSLRTVLGRVDDRELYQDVGPSSRSRPKLTIGLDEDIDDVDALRRRPMLPIRQELGLGQGATSFRRPQSATGFQMPSTTDQTVAPPESRFILSGADGRGGRVRVLKPPRLVPGEASSTSVLGVMRGKRFKSTSHIAGSRSPALKIEHFFGRG